MTNPQPNEDSLEVLVNKYFGFGAIVPVNPPEERIKYQHRFCEEVKALYAPKPDETVEKILQAVYNNGRMADKKLLETNKEDILPWMSVNQAEAVLAAHYAANEQEALKKIEKMFDNVPMHPKLSLPPSPLIELYREPTMYDEQLDAEIRLWGMAMQAAVDYYKTELATLTNQLNQMRGEK